MRSPYGQYIKEDDISHAYAVRPSAKKADTTDEQPLQVMGKTGHQRAEGWDLT